MFRHKIVKSALILTAANIITRLLGFFYRIYMSNTIGAEGMGLYQLISPIYMFAWAFSSAGLSTAVSKLTAEQKAAKNYRNMQLIVFVACTLSAVLAVIASAAVYLGSSFICTYMLKDDRILPALKILTVCFPFMAVGSCLRGWFYGIQEAAVPAQCQVLEQCTRLAAVYVLFSSVSNMGLEYACAAAVLGMAAGEIISCAYVAGKCFFIKRRLKLGTAASLNLRRASTMLLALSLPLMLNRVTGTLLAAVENFLIPSRLQLFGFTRSDAVSIYGELCGMAMPLVMFPSSLLTALATALMPAVSEASFEGSTGRISSAVEKSLMFTSIVGIGTAGLFLTLSDELGGIIYNNQGLGYLLKLLGIVCPFIYMQVTLSGVLNGLGKQLFIFVVNLAVSIFNIGFIFLFVPQYGIEAYIFGWFVSTAATAALSFNVVANAIRLRLYLNNILLKPVAAISLSCVTFRLFMAKAELCVDSPLFLFVALAFIGVVYLMLIAFMGVVFRDYN